MELDPKEPKNVEPMPESGIERSNDINDDEPKFNAIKASPVPLKVKIILGAAVILVAGSMYFTLKSSLTSATPEEVVVVEEGDAPFLPQEIGSPEIKIGESDNVIDLFESNTIEIAGDSASSDAEESSSTNDIIIRPPEDDALPNDLSNTQELNTSIEIDILSSKIKEIEERDTKRTHAVKTSIEIQEQVLQRLATLMSKLDGLNLKLKTISNQAELPMKTSFVSQQKKVTTRAQPKPAKSQAPTNAKLVGTDLWGGDRFAQIDYKGTIHLLALGETIEDWRISAISENSVTLQNNNGDSYELTK
tara:strand:+ start:31781 stop:32695 length:915 start_codon:yes stop_codon:yes gene_type:complete